MGLIKAERYILIDCPILMWCICVGFCEDCTSSIFSTSKLRDLIFHHKKVISSIR